MKNRGNNTRDSSDEVNAPKQTRDDNPLRRFHVMVAFVVCTFIAISGVRGRGGKPVETVREATLTTSIRPSLTAPASTFR